MDLAPQDPQRPTSQDPQRPGTLVGPFWSLTPEQQSAFLDRKRTERWQLRKPHVPTAPEVEVHPTIRDMFSRQKLERDKALMRSLKQQALENPDILDEAEDLGIKLSEDPEAIKKNIAGARRLAQSLYVKQQIDEQKYPVLANELRDPTFQALALDEFDKLAWYERLGVGWESANAMEELAEAANKLRDRHGVFVSKAQEQEYRRLVDRMASFAHVDGFWGMTGQTVSQLATWETAVATGGAVLATFIPPAAPVAVPWLVTAAATVPAAIHTYELEGGLAYSDYLEAGIAEDIARRNSHAVGIFNAMIEMGTLGFLTNPVGRALGNTVKRNSLFRRMLGNAMTTPTATRAWRKTALRVGAAYVSQTAEEDVQEVATALGEYLGKKETEARATVDELIANNFVPLPGGGRVTVDRDDASILVDATVWRRMTGEKLDSDEPVRLEKEKAADFLNDLRDVYVIEASLSDEAFWSDMWSIVTATSWQAFQGVAIIGAFGPTLQHFSEMKRVRAAEEQQQVYQETRDHTQTVRMRQRSSSRMVMLLRKQWRDSKMGEVHIPREEFTKALDDVGLTVEEVEQVFPGLAEQLAKPEEQQPTIVLDGATFFGEVAETELQDRLFEHIKPSANDFTIAEAKAEKAKIDAEAKRLREGMDAANGVRDQVDVDSEQLFEKLTENALRAGVRNKQTARDAAALAVAGIRARAEHASMAKGTLVLPSQLLADMGIDADQMVIAKPEDYDTKTVFRQFAGQRSDTADMDSFRQALQMAEDGADADEIRKTTGWFVGADGQPRYEITDENARWTSVMQGDSRVLMMREATDATTSTVTLADVLDHPELFAAYPELRKVKMEFFDGPVGERGWASHMMIGLNKSRNINDAERMSALLHEVQHIIQEIEGFALGAGPAYFTGLYVEGGSRRMRAQASLAVNLAATVDERLAAAEAAGEQALSPEEKQALKDTIELPWRYLITEHELARAQTQLDDARTDGISDTADLEILVDKLEKQLQALDTRIVNAHKIPLRAQRAFEPGSRAEVQRILREAAAIEQLDNFQLYERTAGEAEARATQARQGLTAEERRETAVDRTFADDQLTRAQLIFRVAKPGEGPLKSKLRLDMRATPATSTKFRQGGLVTKPVGSVKAATVPKNGQFAPTNEGNLTASVATGKGKGNDLDPDPYAITVPSKATASNPASKEATEKNIALLRHNHKSASGTIKRQETDPKTGKKRTVSEKTDAGGYDGVQLTNKKGMARAEALIGFIVRNLKMIFNAVPPAIRERSRLWYDGANRIARELADRYGLTPSQTAGMLAVTSPQADWRMNVSYVERIADTMQNGRQQAWSPEMETWLYNWLYNDEAVAKRAKAQKRREESLARAEVKLAEAKKTGKGLNDAQKTVDKRRRAVERGDVVENAYLAIKGMTLDEVIQRGNPLEMAVWVRTFDEVNNDRGFRDISPEGQTLGYVLSKATGERDSIGWKSFGAIANAISIYLDGSDVNISERLGAKHKVRNFFNNILTPNSAIPFVTADTHQVAANLLLPLAGEDLEVSHNFGTGTGASSTKTTGLSGTYWIHQEAVIRAAAELGVLPRELQSISWEAVRGLFGEDWKSTANTQEVRRIWTKHRKGELTYEQAVEQIVEYAGGWSNPFWVDHPPSSAQPFEGGATTYEGPLRTGGVSGTAGGSGARGQGGGRAAVRRADGRRSADARRSDSGASRTRYRQTEQERRAAEERRSGVRRVVDGGTDALRDGDPASFGNATVVGRLGDAGFEIAADEQGRAEYAQRMRRLLPGAGGSGNKFYASVTFKNPGDLEGAQLFMSPSGEAGVAISADGELQAAWATNDAPPGEGIRLIRAVLDGAKPGQVWATSFATKLPELYSAIGFRAVSRTPFNREFAPRHPDTDAPIWDYQLYGPWQNGEPDVVFYVFDGEVNEYSDAVREGLPSLDDYEAAEAIAKDYTESVRAQDRMRQQGEEQAPRGEFDPESMQIILGKTHDPTTLVHELAHFLFELDTKMALAGVASPQQLRDLGTLLDELGENEFTSVDDYLTADAEKRRKLHEKVAYNFEIYMFEGKAPSAALKDVFRRMSSWMVRIYRKVRDTIAANYYLETMDPATGKGKKLPALTDDVKNVFDRWLAADEEIEIRIREEAIGRLLRAGQLDDLDELDKILLQEIVFDHEHEAKEKLREVLLTELKKLRTMRGRMMRKAQRDSRAERRKREAEERQRLATSDRLARLLNFMSTGELLNADGTVDRSSLQARLEGALNRLYLLMVEQRANQEELAERQSELDATVADSAAQIADKREGIAAVRKELKLLRKSAGDQTTRIEESLEFIASAEQQIEGLQKARKAARDELKAMRNEIKRVDKAIEKAKKSVAVAQRGADGVKGKRLRMFLTDDPRVPEQYRTTDPDKAEIVDVERFARQNGFGSADVMFDALRRQMIGEKKQAVEIEAGGVKYRLPGDPAGEALQDMVNDRTDDRMLAEVPHLADEAQMQFEIDAAMTNEAIIRMRAHELRLMEKKPLAERRRLQEMVRVAREVARVDLGKMTTGQLFGRNNLVRIATKQAQAAERRAAANRGDVEAMNKHQRTALYYRALAEQATKARETIEKTSGKLKKRMQFKPRSGKHEDQLARTYGGAVVETARQMLDLLGVEVGSGVRSQGPVWQDLPADSPERQMLEAADSDLREVVATDGQLMEQPIDQALESLEYVEGVLMQGKWARMFEIEGQTAELDDIIRQLREQVEAEMTPERSRKAPSTVRERIKGKVRQWNYGTQRAEALLFALDGDKQGMLSQLIFVPLRNAEDQVEIHLAAVIEKLAPLLQTVRDEIGSNRELSKPITTGSDATGAPLLVDRSKQTQDADVLENGKLDVLGMLLHCGNESNLRRLLLGFGWGQLRPDGSVDTTRWWEQVRQWEEAGVITAADWEFCQGVWDIYEEELLPMTQEAHFDMLGRRMALVDKGLPVLNRRVMADGTVVSVAGGYVPAGRDPQLRSPKGERNEQDTLLGFQRSIATINKGHTKDRVDEDDPDPMDINPINQILHFRQSIIFAQMGPAHKKVATLLRNDEFSKLLERMAPGIYKNVLDPLMETAATLSSTLVSARGADQLDGLDFIDKLRSNYGTAAMFANVVNSLQGVTGVLLAGMSAQVKWRYLAEGMGGGHTKSEIYAMSPFMAARHKLGVSAFEMQQQVLSLVETGAFQSVKKMQRWIAKNTYWMQEIIQKPVDLIVWRGAYAQAIAEGKTDAAAVNAADGAVRRTQSDTAVTSMAKIEKGARFAKMWTQFLSWFLSLGSMRASAMRSATLKKRETDGTRAAWVLRVLMSKQAMAGFFTLYVGELIATALRGDDEEKEAVDTWLVDPLLMTALAIPRALGPAGAFGATVAAKAIPLVVPELSRDLEFQQRMPAPAAIAIIDQVGRTTKNLLDEDADRSDVLDALELGAKIVGIPLHVLTQRLRRGLNIFEEEKFEEPQGVSLITGRR